MDESLFYESEFQEIILEHSREQYGIEDTPLLLRYLFRRFFIVNLKETKLSRIRKQDFPSSFMKFWLNDLAIPIQNQSFVYKGITFSTLVSYGSPLRNIFEDFLHQLSNYRISSIDEPDYLEEWKEARDNVSEWLREVKRKGKKYTKTPVYPYYLKSELLNKLNQAYGGNVQLPSAIEGFQYQDVVTKLSEEEVCHRHLLAFRERVTDGELLSESELEKYVITHLDDIESGLRFVRSQYILPNGRIDILARDKEGNYVVIELKVEKDTDIVWQKWYYTNEIKKRYNTEKVRFIAILPRFYEEIIEPLLEDETSTKILQFHPFIQRGKLLNARFTPYQTPQMNNV